MKFIKGFFYYVLQFTWGIIQNAAGLIIFIKYRKERHNKFFGACVTYIESEDKPWGGVSLGYFIFINVKSEKESLEATVVHEYGHTIQSLIFGPLYFLIIGLPSAIWCNAKAYKSLRKEKQISYFSRFPENFANSLGEKYTKLPAPR